MVERATSYIALGVAVTVILGFVFETAYFVGFDSRLLQFLTVQDYITASASTLFTIPIIWIIFSANSVGDFLPHSRRFSASLKRFYTEDFEISPKTISLVRRISLVTFMAIMVVPIIAFGVMIASIWITSARQYAMGAIVVAFGAIVAGGFVNALGSFALLGTAAHRRWATIALSSLFLFAVAYFYGMAEGEMIRASQKNDVVLTLKDGEKIKGVFLWKFASGIAYQKPGDASVHFVFNDNLNELYLVK